MDKRQGTSGFEPDTIRSAVVSSTTEPYPHTSCIKLHKALAIFNRIDGSVVEFSPAVLETGVRFPANALTIWRSQSLLGKFFHEI